MSKAFITESDGWFYCGYYQQTCAHADEKGDCMLPECELDAQWLADDDDAGTPASQ